MKKRITLIYLYLFFSLFLFGTHQSNITASTSQTDSIRNTQSELWNDQVYFMWSEGGSIISWKVDDNGNKDPRDDIDLVRGDSVGNSIDLGWTDPEHSLDHNYYTTGTDTPGGYHSSATNVVAQIKTNATIGYVLIRGELGPNAQFQIKYMISVGDPAIYAQVAIVWTRPTAIGFIGYGAHSAYTSVGVAPNYFILGNETESRIDSIPSYSGWHVGSSPRAQYAAFRNSNTGRVIGMAAKSPTHIFEVTGNGDSPWERGLTYFFKYRGDFSTIQPSFKNEFKLYSDRSNSYQMFLARKTVYPTQIPNSILFISPSEGDSIKGIVQIKVKVTSNIIITRVELFIESTSNQRIDITSNYDASAGQYYYEWDTENESNGAHVLRTMATDIAGNRGSNSIHISIVHPINPLWFVGILAFLGLFGTLVYVTRKRVRDSKQRQAMTQAMKQREEELARTERLGELSELAKYEILHFQDLAEKYAVSSSFIQRTIESFVSKGVLWGITTNEAFIGVDFAITTLKKLSNIYRRITWQSLMEEFTLESEKDLKVLLIQVSHSQEVDFTIDEIEKSVQILTVEVLKPANHVPRGVICPSCETSLDPKTNHCENCGEDFQKCIVCHLPVLDDYTKTPCCGSPAHSVHLREWLKIKETCPICKDKLREEWVI